MARVRKRQVELGLEQEKIDLKHTGYWKASDGKMKAVLRSSKCLTSPLSLSLTTLLDKD